MTIDESSTPPAGLENDRRDRIMQWFLVAIASGLAWRFLRFGLHFELTGDESGIMRSVMERGYAALLEPLSYSNVSPPMFLWLTKFVDSVWPSDWAVRLAPFFAGLGSVVLFALICRETLEAPARWIALAVLCVTYVPVTEGTRIKSYTIDLFVATLMLWWTVRWLLDGRKTRYLICLAICAPVFVWFSYTAVFVIGAAGLVFVLALVKPAQPMTRGGGANLAAGFVFMALAGASAILLYLVNVRPGIQASIGNGLADGWKRGYPPSQPWNIPFWFLSAQTGRGFAWPVGENHFLSTPTFVLWLTGLIVYWRRGNRLIWTLFVAPQAFSLVAAFLHKYPYLQNPRLCTFLGPGICLFLGQGAQYLIEKAAPGKRNRCYAAAAIVLTLCAVGGMAQDLVTRFRELRGPGIRATLAATEQQLGPDDQFILLNSAKSSSVFAYYIQREVKQKVLPVADPPAPLAPGQKFALVAVSSKASPADTNALFLEFQKRLGRPLRVDWSETAHQVLLESRDSAAIWVCE